MCATRSRFCAGASAKDTPRVLPVHQAPNTSLPSTTLNPCSTTVLPTNPHLRYQKAWQADVRLRPILLGGLFKAVGNKGNYTVRAKGAYMLQDLARINQVAGIPIHPPKVSRQGRRGRRETTRNVPPLSFRLNFCTGHGRPVHCQFHQGATGADGRKPLCARASGGVVAPALQAVLVQCTYLWRATRPEQDTPLRLDL